MTVYLDVLFFENFILNFIILYAVGIETKSKIKFLRILSGSIIGSIYVIIYYILNVDFFLNIAMKFILSISMIYISFETKEFKALLKKVLFFYLTSFIFAGGALAIIHIVNSGKVSIQNGIIIGKYSLTTIFIGIIVAFVVIVIAFKTIKNKINQKDFLCKLTIKIDDKQINTIAMIDTGNLLKEPITNIPVIVVEESLLENVLPQEILKNSQNILKGNLEELSEDLKKDYISKLKVIPFMSLGKQNGMLLGIKAKEVIVKTEEENKKIDKAIIGIYDKKLSKSGKYHSLIGMIW